MISEKNKLSTDESEYEDCEEMLKTNERNQKPSDSENDETSNEANSDPDYLDSVKRTNTPSAHRSSFIKLKRFQGPNKSLILKGSHLIDKDSHQRATRRKLDTFSLLKKLRQSNEIMSQKVANVTKPLNSSTVGLTKLLPFRKKSQTLNSPDFPIHNDVEQKVILKPGASEDSSQQKSTNSSTSLVSSSNTNSQLALANSSSSGQKRRRDKSQSASLDDALSIIEEKFDDDDNSQSMDGSIKPSNPRLRLLSGGKQSRQITRDKEVDLEDESETSNHNPVGRTLSASSTNDDDMDDTLSSSTLEAKSIQPDFLSSSSLSTSNHTDDTIKFKTELTPQSTKQKLTIQSSVPAPARSESNGLRRSDSDKAPSSPKQNEARLSMMNRYDSSYSNHNQDIGSNLPKRSSPDSKQQQSISSQKVQGTSTNFIQSVRAVKAQQHLLQNMIKHQNRNLLTSSSMRAKNAFMYPNRVYQSEYPFVTLKKYPDRMVQYTGGVVSVHSVKLLDHIINDEESETRDIWWTEIRKEIRSHAKALNCNTILGYSETSKVLDDVCVLSACGTAAILKPIENQQTNSNKNERLNPSSQLQTLKVPRMSTTPSPARSSMPSPRDPVEIQSATDEIGFNVQTVNQNSLNSSNSQMIPGVFSIVGDDCIEQIDCSFCHTPLVCADSISSLANCTICELSKVPDILLLTIEPPENLNIVSGGTLVQARVCRAKRDWRGESSAKEIGDALPFLEYELHRQLFTKLKFKGLNCLFNLSIDISIGENMLTGIATGTGCFVLGLPTPDPPQISAGKGIKTSKLDEIQRLMAFSAMKNREILGLKQIDAQLALYREQVRLLQSTLEINSRNLVQQDLTHQQETDILSEVSPQVPTNIVASTSTSLASSAIALTDHDCDSNYLSDNNLLKRSTTTNLLSAPTSNDHLFHQLGHKRRHHNYHGHRKSPTPMQGQKNASMLAPAENLFNLLTDDNNIILEVDDNEDADIITQLIESDIPEGYLICNSETVPTISQSSITSINMFTQVMRVKLSGMDQFAPQFDWILQGLFVKLRRSLPCCLTNISFVVDLPEPHIVQISLTGCLLGLKVEPIQVLSGSNMAHDEPPDVMCLSQQKRMSVEVKGAIETTSTSASMSPTSAPSSTSSSSASPTSSTATTPNISSSSSSVQSIKGLKESSNSNGSRKQTGTEFKSITKKLSSTNIASLLSGGKLSSVDTKKSNKESCDMIELPEVNKISKQISATKTTIEGIKQEVQQKRLGNQFYSVRAVFKKQQTYPGANSPLISGHDKLLPTTSAYPNVIEASINPPSTSTGHSSSSNDAARRATNLLNKVKQPLKDLGSNFNTSSTTVPTNSTTTSSLTTVQQKTGRLASSVNNSGGGEGSFKFNKNSSSSLRSKSTGGGSGRSGGQVVSGEVPLQSSSNATTSGGQNVAIVTKAGVQDGGRRGMNSSIDISSLSYIPGAKEYHYLGNLSFSFVRETNSVRENGGLNGFIHCFLMEVYAIVRAHVSALGGNAFLSFRLQQSCIFYHSNKNQAQCLISVAGDAVQVLL